LEAPFVVAGEPFTRTADRVQASHLPTNFVVVKMAILPDHLAALVPEPFHRHALVNIGGLAAFVH
jgi:hypothetical protein